ncbi:hypothetical protein GALMADRAFT_52070, partial [Galerina marginata CBS 339.88]
SFSPMKPNTLAYNVAWMDRVFRSRATAEALLSPERDVGTLTQHDYDVSLQFLPDYHRYYPILGCIAATGLLLLRRPKSNTRSAIATFTYGFTGYTLGKVSMLNAHYNYVRSLENPAGFGKAMENVQAKLGGLVPPSFIIERAYEPSPDDPNQIPDTESRIILPTPSDSAATNTDQTSAQPTLSRWDQIRKINNQTAHNSSWDIIRQRHERDTVKSSKNNDGPELFWDDAATSDVDPSRTQQ